MTHGEPADAPLAGRPVLIACSARKMPALIAGIEAMGGAPIPFPAIEIREMEDMRPLDSALASLDTYSWILFTSAHAVHFFAKHLQRAGLSASSGILPRICAVGPATARELREAGLPVDLMPQNFAGEGLIEALREYYGAPDALAGRRMLFPRARDAREIVPETLAGAGVQVDVVPCYHTVSARPDPEMLRRMRDAPPDLVVFTSPSAVRSLAGALGPEGAAAALAASAVAVIGPVTAGAVAPFGPRALILPGENTIPSLLQAIRRHYSPVP